MPTELSSRGTGYFNMQLRNVRHVARIIETETSVYRLIPCIQIDMVYFYAVCDSALEWFNIPSRNMSLYLRIK
jgi:hypothetical protein